MTAYVLYNKKAGSKDDTARMQILGGARGGELKILDVEDISDYSGFIGSMKDDDYIVLCGGDGTLNKFVNNMEGIEYDGEVLYYPSGTGNDFAHELGHDKHSEPFSVKEYIKNLPTVKVNGISYRFINGVGFGIDGYCCEVGDKIKAEDSDKKINYTAIAIKGLLFHYKPTNAVVTVDGIRHEFRKVWIAPTMHGKFYGGGMMPTPEQDRMGDKLSVMLFHGTGKLRTLMIFPSLFSGEHIKHTKNISVLCGKEITVEFDSPRALQIDGETILGVTSYTAYAPSLSAQSIAKDEKTEVTV